MLLPPAFLLSPPRLWSSPPTTSNDLDPRPTLGHDDAVLTILFFMSFVLLDVLICNVGAALGL